MQKVMITVGMGLVCVGLLSAALIGLGDEGFERSDCIVESVLNFPSDASSSDMEMFKEKVTEILWDPSLVGLGELGGNLASVRFQYGHARADLIMYFQFRRYCGERIEISRDLVARLIASSDLSVEAQVSERTIYPSAETIEHCSMDWVDCQ